MSFQALHNFAHEHRAIFLAGVFCAWFSLSMIARMWLKYPGDSFFKKAGWSVVLCIPFFGWLFYGAFYSPLKENDVRAESNPNVMSGGLQ